MLLYYYHERAIKNVTIRIDFCLDNILGLNDIKNNYA